MNIVRQITLALIRDGLTDRDLSARQLAVLLEVYSVDDGQTVRGLAAKLRVSKPAITRALDRLVVLGLACRRPDPADGRSVLVGRTGKGAAYRQMVRELERKAVQAAFPRLKIAIGEPLKETKSQPAAGPIRRASRAAAPALVGASRR